jgi:hypothetical protein
MTCASPNAMHPARRRRRRRAFATTTALTLLAIVGVALAALATLLAADARRTRTAAQEAQLRQLLLAGAAAAGDRARGLVADAPEQTWEIPLPAALEGDAILTVSVVPDDDRTTHRLRIIATSRTTNQSQAQVLTYDAASATLRAAELEY